AVRKDRHVVRKLQRSDEEVSLADTEVHGFARIPDLFRGALEILALPFLRRQESRLLAADVDTGDGAETEWREELGDVVHADVVRETVEVHVAGLGDRVAQVHRAVPA